MIRDTTKSSDTRFPAAISSTSSLESIKMDNADNNSALHNNEQKPQLRSIPESAQLQPKQTAPPSSTSSVISPTAAQPMGQPLVLQPPLSLPPALQHSNPVPLLPGSAHISASSVANNSIPEFLFQLTRMLTDDNRSVIEWSKGMIEVHSPHKLEKDVLQKYFRHSKFASFQRQLNYFGFRKLAGKGKMAPCSYVNDATRGADISALLLIKRKTSVPTGKDKAAKKAPTAKDSSQGASTAASIPSSSGTVNPVLAGILHRAKDNLKPAPPMPSQVSVPGAQQAIARTAIGRGIRHGYILPKQPPPPSKPLTAAQTVKPAQATAAATEEVESSAASRGHQKVSFDRSSNGQEVDDSLSQLASNYTRSLSDLARTLAADTEPTPLSQMRNDGDNSPFGNFGFLSRDSSLVDLAMIPSAEEDTAAEVNEATDSVENAFQFVDFPDPGLHPSSLKGSSDDGENEF